MKSTITQREKEIFDELRNDQLKDWETFKKPKYKGVWDQIINKYPEKAHFIYELLQNADDAKATNARFLISKKGLCFIHNGKRHFSITPVVSKINGDVNAILSIGYSGSEKDGINSIGKFGYGFKSVFQFTNAPEIYDDKFRFRIENYIIPDWIDYDHKFRRKGETLFYFPFKNRKKDYEIIINRLRNLKSPILFLPNLRQVSWCNESTPDELTIYSKSVKDILVNKNIQCQLITESNGEQKEKILMFTRPIKVIDENHNKRTHNIQVGYYLKNEGNESLIDTYRRPNIFCFFSTSEKFGMCFIAHAPFETTDNRDRFHPDSTINKHLIGELIKLAAQAIPILCQISLNNSNLLSKVKILDILHWSVIRKQLNNEQKYSWQTKEELLPEEEIIYNEFFKIITSKPVFLVEGGAYKKAEKTFYPEENSILEVFSSSQIKQILGSNNIGIIRRPNTSYIPFLNKIGVNSLDNNRIGEKISPEFMAKQPLEWLAVFYKYIKERDNDDCVSSYKFSPIILTSSEEWISIYDKTGKRNKLFLLESNKYSCNDDENHYVHPTLIENEEFKRALSNLGINKPQFKFFLEQDILPKYIKDEVSINNDILKNDFRVIIENLYDNNLDSKERKDILQILKSDFLIAGKSDHLYHCDHLLYNENSAFEKCFEEHEDNDYSIVDIDFYDNVPEDKKKRFIKELGIHDTFWIAENTYYDGKGHNGIDSAKCTNYILSGSNGIRIKDNESSLFLWESLKKYFKKKYVYYLRGSKSQLYKMYPNKKNEFSDFIIWLRENKWIAFESGKLFSPNQITKTEFHSNNFTECEELESLLGFLTESQRQENLAREKAENELLNKEMISNKLYELFDGNLNRAIELLNEQDSYERKRVTVDRQRYLGRKILQFYYTEKQHLKLEEGDLLNDAYDFKIGDNIFILMHITDYSLGDDIVPLRLTMKQIQLIQENSNSVFRIVRMSLKDLGIKHENIDAIYEKDANIHKNERLQHSCDKKAEKYWQGHNTRQFENSIAQFSITLKEYIEHVLS